MCCAVCCVYIMWNMINAYYCVRACVACVRCMQQRWAQQPRRRRHHHCCRVHTCTHDATDDTIWTFVEIAKLCAVCASAQTMLRAQRVLPGSFVWFGEHTVVAARCDALRQCRCRDRDGIYIADMLCVQPSKPIWVNIYMQTTVIVCVESSVVRESALYVLLCCVCVCCTLLRLHVLIRGWWVCNYLIAPTNMVVVV